MKKEILLYEAHDGKVKVEVKLDKDTFWLTQKEMAELFGCSSDNISLHLKNIFITNELDQSLVTEKSSATAADGKNYTTNFYNLDAIIAVGYRINSIKATRFRIWSTNILKEYILKGFVLDDDRLKHGKSFGEDYFDELLARIREIRTSEKRFYQKIRDLFILSEDYDKTDRQTELFFAEIQNKLLYAVTKHTAAEIIVDRANSELPYMGLTAWKGSIPRKEDIYIAKNYLNADEIDTLNRVVALFLDTAELRVKEKIPLSLEYWKVEAVKVIQFSNKRILEGSGSMTHEAMKTFVTKEYDIFALGRKKEELIQQDKEEDEDIEKLIEQSKKINKL
jgi:hypothetical protein